MFAGVHDQVAPAHQLTGLSRPCIDGGRQRTRRGHGVVAGQVAVHQHFKAPAGHELASKTLHFGPGGRTGFGLQLWGQKAEFARHGFAAMPGQRDGLGLRVAGHGAFDLLLHSAVARRCELEVAQPAGQEARHAGR